MRLKKRTFKLTTKDAKGKQKRALCASFLYSCRECGYRFKHRVKRTDTDISIDERICPICKTERQICKKRCYETSHHCKSHGGTIVKQQHGKDLSKAIQSLRETEVNEEVFEKTDLTFTEARRAFLQLVAQYKAILAKNATVSTATEFLDNTSHSLELLHAAEVLSRIERNVKGGKTGKVEDIVIADERYKTILKNELKLAQRDALVVGIRTTLKIVQSIFGDLGYNQVYELIPSKYKQYLDETKQIKDE